MHMAAAELEQQQFVEYFRSGFKPRDQFRIGMEAEYLCRRAADGQRIAYEGDPASVLALLQDLQEEMKGEPITVEGRLVGLRSPQGNITLEPGGQIEWSSPPFQTLTELLEAVDAWKKRFATVCDRRGVLASSTAYDDDTTIEEIPWVPKPRYARMRDHYRDRREICYDAMANTAGIHVALDFEDEADWRRKFQAMLWLTPLLAGICGNSPGERNGKTYRTLRPLLWLAMDPSRCVPPKSAFERHVQMRHWAYWASQTPRLFEDPSDTGPDWKRRLSTIFAPVRVGRYLEARNVDMQPPARLAAIPALFYGLLYCPQALDELLQLLQPLSNREVWRVALVKICEEGFGAAPKIESWEHRVVEIARGGLERMNENAGLRALEALV